MRFTVKRILARVDRLGYNIHTAYWGGIAMSELEIKALKNAAASSAMEGLPLNDGDLAVIMGILDGRINLQDFFRSLKLQEQDA